VIFGKLAGVRILPCDHGRSTLAASDRPPHSDERRDDRDDEDEAPETPLDEPAPPEIQDPPADAEKKGPYTV
jgi:hypothetical protein